MQRGRRIGASILAVLTAVLLLLSSFGWWAERYFLDSERFTENANEILEEEAVQNALAVAITDELSDAAGRDLEIARPFVTTIVREVVQSDQFQTVFDAAVLRLHRAIVGGGARDAVLNLSDIVDRIRDAIEPIAPDLADSIPSGEELRIVILDRSELDTIYDVVNLVEDTVVVLTVLTVVFFAGALALSPRRWRTLALAGWVTLGLFAVSLLAIRIGRPVVGSLAQREEYSEAARAAYKVITHGLVVQGIVLALLGLLVALGSGWTDRHGGWAAIRAAGHRAVAWVRAQVPQRAPRPTPAAADAGAPDGAIPAAAALAEPPSVPADDLDARAGVVGVLAPRLPAPTGRARQAHWWRAAALVVLGLFAVFSPTSLTTVIVVLLGVVALYLALTEAVAAWGSPKEPTGSDASSDGSTAEP